MAAASAPREPLTRLHEQLRTIAPDIGRICGHSAADGAPVRDVLDRVSDKWSLLIIGTLEDGALRFTEIQRAIPGISQRMLSITLRSLERDGLVTRTAYAQIPPRVEYAVTDLGRTLVPAALELVRWAYHHHGDLEDNRRRFDDVASQSSSVR